MLQLPLEAVISVADMEAGLAKYEEYYYTTYRQLMVDKLGFEQLPEQQANELLGVTIQFLKGSQMSYHAFFAELAEQFDPSWRDDLGQICNKEPFLQFNERSPGARWRELYNHNLQDLSTDELNEIATRFQEKNPKTALLRPVIEEVWNAIAQEDNWQPFYKLVQRLQQKN